ncbi:metallophosphoesterase family protein, partial [Candidatus Hydrogenedentota bacterium]
MNRLCKPVLVVVLILGFAGCASFTRDTQFSETSFSFVQITDTHLGSRENLERTERVIERINNLPMDIECVVHTGDIFTNVIEDKETREEGRTVFGKLKIPIHFAPGNHDILRRRAKAHTAIFKEEFGALSSRAEYKGVVFLVAYDESPFEGYDFLDWMERELKAASDKPVIVFHHIPSVKDFHGNKMHDGWPKDRFDRWIELLNSHNVKAVITGHFSNSSRHLSTVSH